MDVLGLFTPDFYIFVSFIRATYPAHPIFFDLKKLFSHWIILTVTLFFPLSFVYVLAPFSSSQRTSTYIAPRNERTSFESV